VVIDSVHSLSDAVVAQHKMLTGDFIGKILLVP